jgi:hypothetical protein
MVSSRTTGNNIEVGESFNKPQIVLTAVKLFSEAKLAIASGSKCKCPPLRSENQIVLVSGGNETYSRSVERSEVKFGRTFALVRLRIASPIINAILGCTTE